MTSLPIEYQIAGWVGVVAQLVLVATLMFVALRYLHRRKKPLRFAQRADDQFAVADALGVASFSIPTIALVGQESPVGIAAPSPHAS